MNDDTDSGARHRRQDDLPYGELRAMLATDAAGIGVWSWDLLTGEMSWSNAMYRLLEMPEGAPVTVDSFLERVRSEDRPALSETLRQCAQAQGGDGGSLEYGVVRPDGSVRYLSGRGRVITDDSGHSVVHGVAVDITSAKETGGRERELRQVAEEASRRLEFLAEASHILSSSLDYQETLTSVARLTVPGIADWCAIDLLDEAGKLVRVTVEHQDPQKVRLAHELQERYPPDADSGSGGYRVVSSGKPELYREIGDADLVAGARDEEHLRLLREVGFSSALVVPLISRGQPLGVLILVQSESGRRFDELDLQLAMQLAERSAQAVDNARLYREARTSSREFEKRVAVRTAELEALNRELEAFTYSASHDLRAPLRGIDGFAQALLEDYGQVLDQQARRYLQRVKSGAARMEQIIDALLALSDLHRSQLKRTRIDLSAKADDTLRRLREADPQRTVEICVAEGVDATGDASMVRLLLDNLLGNAWKFTRESEPARIEFGTEEREGERAYFVRDNGVGFDMAYASKLFEPFQRLHPPDRYAGTGVGLTTVKRIVDRHGGRIWAEGEAGRGATFYFTLAPAAEE